MSHIALRVGSLPTEHCHKNPHMIQKFSKHFCQTQILLTIKHRFDKKIWRAELPSCHFHAVNPTLRYIFQKSGPENNMLKVSRRSVGIEPPLKDILFKYARGERGRAQHVSQCAREKRPPRDCTRRRRRQTSFVF